MITITMVDVLEIRVALLLEKHISPKELITIISTQNVVTFAIVVKIVLH